MSDADLVVSGHEPITVFPRFVPASRPAPAAWSKGPLDELPVEEVLQRLPSLRAWSEFPSVELRARLGGARCMLEWLQHQPGDGWQAKWMHCEPDPGPLRWVESAAIAKGRVPKSFRADVVNGLAGLLLHRVFLPGYDFLVAYYAVRLFTDARAEMSAELFSRAEAAAAERGMVGRQIAEVLTVLTKIVRSFYLDIQEWAHEDPSWAPWAVRCPIRRSELEGMAKKVRATTAKVHQRIRERLPHLPALVESAEQHRQDQAALLETARQTPIEATFEHNGTAYRRILRVSDKRGTNQHGPEAVMVENTATGETVDMIRQEEDAFWTWSIIETLRHTGVRIEELMELTHLALISYRLPETGEIIPLLQIVPSKSNEERLLLVPPELASVLAAVICRIRDAGGRVPLAERYDPHERLTGPPLPHLFQRKIGWRREILSSRVIYRLLGEALDRAGLTDRTGQPLRYTPHDFRRMFITDAVTGGLPVHIAAKILGHHDLSTTQAYLAVFQEDLIKNYRAFLDSRRAVRPATEYREPTDEEWKEFQKHFELRKVELGTCGRPYGTPCAHEHACIRCPMLRVDPAQRRRLEEIIRNLGDRIDEARAYGWAGEVQGLQISLEAARNKLASLNRLARNNRRTTVNLGMPITRGKLQ